MATRTTTFEEVRKKYAALAGLDPDAIIPVDATVFIQFFNRNYRFAWARAEWPFSTALNSFVPDSSGFIDLSTDTAIADILDVFTDDPFTSSNSKPLRYSIRGDGVFVPDAAEGDSLTVATLVSVGTLATCTTSVDHNYLTGDSAIIAGANEAAYNGTFVITVTSTTAFEYTMASDPVDTATGTITSTKTTAFIFYRANETVFDGTLAATVEFVFQDYLATACFADFLAAEGQQNKSQSKRLEAEAVLDIEVDRLERQQQQQLPSRTSTRLEGVR